MSHLKRPSVYRNSITMFAGPKIIQNILIIFLYVFKDPVVLESPTFLRPGRPGQVPAVCYRDVQGAPAGFCCSRGHEWHPEVPDPP